MLVAGGGLEPPASGLWALRAATALPRAEGRWTIAFGTSRKAHQAQPGNLVGAIGVLNNQLGLTIRHDLYAHLSSTSTLGALSYAL